MRLLRRWRPVVVVPALLAVFLCVGFAHAAHLHKLERYGERAACSFCLQHERLAAAPPALQTLPGLEIRWRAVELRPLARTGVGPFLLYRARAPPRS